MATDTASSVLPSRILKTLTLRIRLTAKLNANAVPTSTAAVIGRSWCLQSLLWCLSALTKSNLQASHSPRAPFSRTNAQPIKPINLRISDRIRPQLLSMWLQALPALTKSLWPMERRDSISRRMHQVGRSELAGWSMIHSMCPHISRIQLGQL